MEQKSKMNTRGSRILKLDEHMNGDEKRMNSAYEDLGGFCILHCLWLVFDGKSVFGKY
jgi:hypothetical protein